MASSRTAQPTSDSAASSGKGSRAWRRFFWAMVRSCRYNWHAIIKDREARVTVAIVAPAKHPDRPVLILDSFMFHGRGSGVIVSAPLEDVREELGAWHDVRTSAV